jgi:hypothetical protein
MMSRFSVTEPASDVSLLTAAELRAAVGATDGSQDAALAIIGRRVSTAISRQCNIVDDGVNPPTLLRETCTEIFRWDSCGPIKLARRPVTSITSVTIDGEAVDADEYEVEGRDLYALTDDELSEWAAGKITVVYVAGYATAPDDLKLAAAKLVTATNAESTRDPSLKREEIPGVMEAEYWVAPSGDPLLSREIADLLSPYVERFV